MIFAIETPDRICPQTVTAPYNGRWRAVEEEQQQNNEECIPYSNPRTRHHLLKIIVLVIKTD